MKKVLLALAALVLVLCAAAILMLRPPSPPASQVFVNGVVLTLDARNSIAEAVAIERDRIVAVGTRADVESHIGDAAVVHDLEGRTLLPGFVDAHGHFPGSGFATVAVDLNSPPIGAITDMEGLLAALRSCAAEKSAGEWIVGFGYDDSLLAEKRHPTRDELDLASDRHPIYLLHVSGHMAVANSRALELAGIDESSEAPEGGVIVKDASGRLTGLLEETAANGLRTLALDFSIRDFYDMIAYASDEYASVGVTTAQSGGVDGRMLQGLSMASRIGIVPFRLVVFPLHDELGPEVLEGGFDPSSHQTDRFFVGPVKMISDGSIQGYTGYLSEPYHVQREGETDYRGYPTIPGDELNDWVGRYHAAGQQLAIHANGDAAIDAVIHAFRQAQRSHPTDDPRLVLIHSQMARPDQLDAMLEIGITPSFFSAHTYYWGDRHWNIFMGPERAARMSPARTSLEMGLRFSVHLDTPVVPMSPLLGVWATVNRLSTGGNVIGEGERIPVMEALRAVTIDAAWQVFREDEIGSIEPGKLADLVVLDANPLERPRAIRDIEVVRTVVGGVTIYAR